MPENEYVVSKRAQRRAVGRYGVVSEISGNDLREPFPGFRNWPVHSMSQCLLDFPERRAHAVAARLPPDPEVTPLGFIENEHEAQELEGFRFGTSAPLAVLRRKATELNQAGLLRMKRQRELPQPVAHRVPEAASVVLMLEAHDCVIGVSDHDHVARGLAPSPAFGPEIEDVMKINVREQWRNHRTLPRPLFLNRHYPVFKNARSQPFLDEPDDALVADPVLQEADNPLLGNLREERPDVGVEDEVHLPAADSDDHCIQRIVLAALRPKSVREPEKIFLVDHAQHRRHRSLDDLVFERGDRERALAAVFLRNVAPPGR